MKKSLLFVAAIFAALTANAQQTWHCVNDGDQFEVQENKVVITPGTSKSTAGEHTQVAADVFGDNIKVFLCDGGADWTVKNEKATAGTFVASNGVEYSKSYIQGGTNGSAGSLDKGGTESAHIEVEALVDGKLAVAAKYGKNKPIWAASVETATYEDVIDYLDLTAQNNMGVWGQYIKDDGTLGDAVAATATADVYSALEYDLKAGNTYFFWVSGSKIMLCGLTFTAGAGTGINGITVDGADNANAPVYNLAGQRVSKDAKGILIQNGKKFIK